MPKLFKKSHFAVLILILLMGLAYTSMTPFVQAETASSQKSLMIISNVVGVQLTNYEFIQEDFPQEPYKGVLPQENIRYFLTSDKSKIDLVCSYVNGNLRSIQVLEREGSPFTTKTTSSNLDMAKDFLGNYLNFTKNPFYKDLCNMIDNVEDNKNASKIVEEKKGQNQCAGRLHNDNMDLCL